MHHRNDVITTAARAVILLLRLGRDSLNDEIASRDDLALSPIAGLDVGFELASAVLVGPENGEGHYHVTMRMSDGHHHVEAYCEVTCDETRIILIRPVIYVNGHQLSRRNVTVGPDGGLLPWSMPSAYDLGPDVAAVRLPQLVAI